MFDVWEVRKDFPILETGVIYLDSTATSLTPEPVLQKILEYYREYRGNVGRGVHRLSQRASEEVECARAKVADFINAKSDSEIIMTRNTSEGINTISQGLDWKKGDKIVTSIVEHHSNFIVWLRVKNRFDVDLEIVRPSVVSRGLFDPADFEKVIDDKTRLVAVTHVSNVLGSITPIEEIAKIAHEHGAYVLIDAAQSVPHMKVDVQKIGCDFLAFSGHKMCGPTGVGILYIREELIEKIEPLSIGGGAIVDVGLDYYKLIDKSPARFEAGTPAIAEMIGLGAAVDYLQRIGMKNIEDYERVLAKQMYESLSEIPKVEVYGPETKDKVAIMPFNVADLNPHDVALALDVSANIMVRSGHHCALPLTKSFLRKPGTVRASAYFYNTNEEIEKLTSAVKELAQALAR